MVRAGSYQHMCVRGLAAVTCIAGVNSVDYGRGKGDCFTKVVQQMGNWALQTLNAVHRLGRDREHLKSE